MGFNYRKERKKFEEQMIEMEKKYHAAGMSDEQIVVMREYEEEQFRRERIYKIHTILERPKQHSSLWDLLSTRDEYFHDMKPSFDAILDR